MEEQLVHFVADLTAIAGENLAGENRFQGLFEGAGVGLMLLDQSGRITDLNPTVTQLLGVDSDQLLGQPFDTLVWPSDRAAERARFHRLRSYKAEVRHRRANGAPAWLQVSVTRLGSGQQILRALSDVSDRRLGQLVRFQELERLVLSSELHDVTAQELWGLSLETAARQPDLERLRELAGQAGTHLRELIARLRNPILSGSRPFQAIRQLLRRFGGETGWPLRVRLEGSDRKIPELTALFLYRIVAESLHNARRYSQSERLLVRLQAGEKGVRGRIRDYGKGLQPGAGEGRHGLEGMRTRARLLGGRLRLRNHPAGGLQTDFWLPYRSNLL
jgi:PAS domain S-box-containing protein